MSTENKEQKHILDKFDELLSIRESKKDSLQRLNNVIEQGIEKIGGLPNRWYVRKPGQSVVNYLNDKYDKQLSEHGELYNIGYGEIHGEFAFIPHDVDYSWEITQNEFDFAISLIKNQK